MVTSKESMNENLNLGICRCADSPGGSLLATFSFWWAEIKVFFCKECDGLTVEILASNSERVPDRTLCDIFNDLPGGRSVIVLDASWIESLANLVRTYARQPDLRGDA
jgi:hypothetical protein